MTVKNIYIYFMTAILLAGIFTANTNSVAKAPVKVLQARFIGNEAFRISDGEYVLLTDFPYQSGAYGYMEYEFNFPDTQKPDARKKVLSLITHRHMDHFDPIIFSQQNWKIFGPRQVTLPLDQTKILSGGDSITYGPITIIPKKTLHANVEHFSYLVNWGGLRMFFTGDTEELTALEGLPDLDALFISPWFYRKAKLSDRLPASKKIIIYHHKEKDIIPDCRGCIIPRQGEKIILE